MAGKEWVRPDVHSTSYTIVDKDQAVQGLLAEGDRGCLYSVARALTQLQAVTGAVTRVKGKGPSAAALRRLLARMRRELGAAAPPLGMSQAEPCLML